MKFLLYQLIILLCISHFTTIGQVKIKHDPVWVKVMSETDNYNKHLDLGGLSAIEYSGYKNIYYVVADKPPFRIYTLKIDIGKTIDYQVIDTLVFPGLKFEAEGIRVIDSLSCFFVSDEQNTNTSVYKYFDGHMQKIEAIPSLHKTMRHNSGYEGIALSKDKSSLYFAVERPLSNDKRKKCNPNIKPYISIFEYNIENDKIINEFAYPLVNPSKDNGVSEILVLNDSVMLVMERAWTNNRSIVSVNAVNIKSADNILDFKCEIPKHTKFLRPEVLIDFRAIENKFTRYNSYNFEGMTIAHTGKHILFITDNNFSPNQTTYLMALEIEF
ncbi:MAG: esterase-like activity of phytase family protein [Bacteroidales bacterium]